MRRTWNLVLPLAISVACVSLCYTFLQIRTERRNLRNELTRRSAIVAENIAESIESSRDKVTSKNLSHLLYRYVPRESLSGIAVRSFRRRSRHYPGTPRAIRSTASGNT